MGRAPSEKHLEQWIVDHPELFRDEVLYESFNCPFVDDFVARQLRLPSGVADLVGIDGYGEQLLAIELKVDVLDARAMAQVMRYVNDLRNIWSIVELEVLGLLNYDQYHYHKRHDDPAEIGGCLVCYKADDVNLIRACTACSINVIEYDYTGDEYTFQVVTDDSSWDHKKQYEQFANGWMRDVMRSIMRERAGTLGRRGEL